MTQIFLSSAQAAERVGITPGTWDSYIHKDLTPPPDALIGRVRGWLPQTIDEWHKNRPGQGARTDLKEK